MKGDNMRAPACGQCGNPNNLRLCTGCKKRYCRSKECQKVSRVSSLTIGLTTFLADALEGASQV